MRTRSAPGQAAPVAQRQQAAADDEDDGEADDRADDERPAEARQQRNRARHEDREARAHRGTRGQEDARHRMGRPSRGLRGLVMLALAPVARLQLHGVVDGQADDDRQRRDGRRGEAEAGRDGGPRRDDGCDDREAEQVQARSTGAVSEQQHERHRQQRKRREPRQLLAAAAAHRRGDERRAGDAQPCPADLRRAGEPLHLLAEAPRLRVAQAGLRPRVDHRVARVRKQPAEPPLRRRCPTRR